MNSTTAKLRPSPDPVEIRRALEVLFAPGDTFEIRALNVGRKGTLSGYYSDIDAATADAVKISNLAPGTYVTLNRLDGALLARRANRFEEWAKTTTSDDPKQVIRRSWLLVDVDAKRPSGISATDQEHAAGLAKLKVIRDYLVDELGFPEPVEADSGNGGHLLCRIDRPNDEKSTAVVQRCLQALDAKFSDEEVHVDTRVYNAARIVKLYGTVAKKGDNTPERPHRLAKLLHVPDSIKMVPVEKLEGLAAMAPVTEQPAGSNGMTRHGSNSKFDVAEYLTDHGVDISQIAAYTGKGGAGEKFVLKKCVWNPEHSRGEAVVIQYESGVIAAMCQHQSCGGKEWHDLRDVVEPGWREKRESRARRDETPYDDEPARERRTSHDPDRVHLRGVTCQELAQAEYDITFLIDHSIVEQSPMIIGAAPKCCKTLLALDAAVSLATATPFLGVLDVPEACRVGFLSGEGGLPVLQEYAFRIAGGRGIDLADIGGLVFCDTLPQLGDLRHIDALERFLKDWELRVVTLDPLYLCMPGDDANNILKQGKILRNVNQVCLRNGATPILIHHTKRNPVDPFAPPELSDLSWSGFSEFAGQWWLIGRREKYDADQPGEHRFWLNIGGRAGHSALHAVDIHEGARTDQGGRQWDVELLRATEARESSREQQEVRRDAERKALREKKLDRDKVKLSRAMIKFPCGETESVLRTRAGLSGTEFKPAMAALLGDDQAQECDVRKCNRKAPYPGYKPKDTHP